LLNNKVEGLVPVKSFLTGCMFFLLMLAGVPAAVKAGIRPEHPRIFVNNDPAYYNCLDSLRLRVWRKPWRTEYEKLRMVRNSFDDVPRGRKKANVIPSYAIRWLIDPAETAAADTALAMMLPLSSDDSQSWNLSVVSIAYDWLHGYSGFSESDKRLIRERIESWTRDCIHQIRTDDDVFNNHTWYHLRAVYLAALALHGESEEAVEWLEFANRYWHNNLSGAVKLFEGGWHEGLSYSCRASLMNLAMWSSALQSSSSPRQWPFARLRQQGGDWLNKFTKFYAAQVYPDGSLARYGDVPPFIAGGGWDNSRLFMIIAREYKNPLAAWIVQNADREGQYLLPLHIWYYLLWYNPAVEPRPPSESVPRAVRLNPGTYDLFFMRSGWEDDATVVSFHAGDWFGSHDNLDVGHFSIFRKEWLALDAGVYAPMGTSHYVNYSSRTLAHNSLLIHDPQERFQLPHPDEVSVVNDGGQRVVVSLGGRSTQNNRDVGVWKHNRLENAHFERATVLHFYAGDTLDFVSADITMAYNSDFFSSYGRDFSNRPKVEQVVRSLAYVRPSTVVIYDRILAKDPSFTKTWILNTANQPYLGENCTFLAENGSSVLAGRTLLPVAPKREIWGSQARPFNFQGEDMHHGLDLWNYPEVEPGGWILRVSQAEKDALGEFLHVMAAGDKRQTTPELLEGWKLLEGHGLRAAVNCEMVLAFVDGTEMNIRLELPVMDEDRTYRVYLLGVAEGVPYDLRVGEQTIEGVHPDNGVMALEAAAGSVIRLKPRM
jgi:hypothetical protein